MPLDYEKKYKQAYEENVKDTPRAAKEGELDRKIDSFCALHGFSREDVINEINNSPMLAAQFAKNPNTQNFYEKEAAKFIKAIKGITEFENLPNRKLLLIGGLTMSADEARQRGGSSGAKSIDFTWKYKGKTFYATHKYTKDSGGSQDSAYKDIQLFISEANQSVLPDTYFIAIADGNYYGMQNGQANTTKIERLKQLSNRNKVFACTIDELEALMKTL